MPGFLSIALNFLPVTQKYQEHKQSEKSVIVPAKRKGRETKEKRKKEQNERREREKGKKRKGEIKVGARWRKEEGKK